MEQLRDLRLRTIAGLGDQYGITFNVLPGSEQHFNSTALAAMVAPSFANEKIAVSAANPLDVQGDALIEMCETHGVIPRLASAASGLIEVQVVSGSVIIPAGYVCTAPNGTQFETTSVNTVVDGDTVQVIAVKGGSDTNLAAGTSVSWDSSSVAFLKQSATVGAGGLTGGADDDTPEELRGRLLERLSSPSNGGNWSFVREIARAASAAVKGAVVYPAIQGPGSFGVAVYTDTGNRQLENDPHVNTVAAALVAKLPGHTKINVTSVSAQDVDLILSATLPDSIELGGNGTGWLDASPFPSTANGPVKITACDTGTGTITVNLASVPSNLAAGTHFAVWDYADETVYHFTAVTVTDVGASLEVVVQEGLPKDLSGAYLSADCVGLDDYAADFLAAMRGLGPGQKTTSVALLPRAARKPTVDEESPSDITTRLPDQVTAKHREIRSLEVTQSYDTGTTNTRTAPSVPVTTSAPPNILVLKHLALIKL